MRCLLSCKFVIICSKNKTFYAPKSDEFQNFLPFEPPAQMTLLGVDVECFNCYDCNLILNPYLVSAITYKKGLHECQENWCVFSDPKVS